MKDLVMGINNIPKRWLKRRFVHTQFVQRLMPAPYNVGALITQPSPPFLLLRNLVAQVTGAAPVDGLQNEWRTKGHDNPAIPEGAYEAPLVGVYGWTSALYFQKPVIITSLSLRCWQPTQYAWNNDWVYHADAPEPHEEGDYLEDLFMEISVDNPFNLENRELNDVELHKLRFSVGCQMMAEPALAVPNNGLNLAPCFTTQDLQLWVHLDNLCIPLHRDTRARITLGIPQYRSEGWCFTFLS